MSHIQTLLVLSSNRIFLLKSKLTVIRTHLLTIIFWQISRWIVYNLLKEWFQSYFNVLSKTVWLILIIFCNLTFILVVWIDVENFYYLWLLVSRQSHLQYVTCSLIYNGHFSVLSVLGWTHFVYSSNLLLLVNDKSDKFKGRVTCSNSKQVTWPRQLTSERMQQLKPQYNNEKQLLA